MSSWGLPVPAPHNAGIMCMCNPFSLGYLDSGSSPSCLYSKRSCLLSHRPPAPCLLRQDLSTGPRTGWLGCVDWPANPGTCPSPSPRHWDHKHSAGDQIQALMPMLIDGPSPQPRHLHVIGRAHSLCPWPVTVALARGSEGQIRKIYKRWSMQNS